MADFNSSLPVRTENNGDVVTQLCDGTTPSQKAGVDTHGSVQASIFNSAGNANSPTAPVYVSSTDVAGTDVTSYATDAALAAGATANNDYTVTALKTFYCQQVWASGSGKIKVVVQFETAPASGIFNTFWVGFNSTAEPNILIPMPPSKTQVAGARIRISITNNDKASQDVYSTLSGNEQ